MERIVRGGLMLGQEGARCRREAQGFIVHGNVAAGQEGQDEGEDLLHQLQQDADNHLAQCRGGFRRARRPATPDVRAQRRQSNGQRGHGAG